MILDPSPPFEHRDNTLEKCALEYGFDKAYIRRSDRALQKVKQLDFTTVYHYYPSKDNYDSIQRMVRTSKIEAKEAQNHTIPEEKWREYTLALMALPYSISARGGQFNVPVGNWILPTEPKYEKLTKLPLAWSFRD